MGSRRCQIAVELCLSAPPVSVGYGARDSPPTTLSHQLPVGPGGGCRQVVRNKLSLLPITSCPYQAGPTQRADKPALQLGFQVFFPISPLGPTKS